MGCNADVADPENAPAAQHRQHRHNRPPRSAHNARDTVGKGKQKEKQCADMRDGSTDLNDLRLVIEKGYKLGCDKVENNADSLGYQAARANRKPRSALGALIFVRSEILPDKGG